MAKIKWFKVTEDIAAQFELNGQVFNKVIEKGSEIETGRHPAQILLPNGDIVWGLTTIPAKILKPVRA